MKVYLIRTPEYEIERLEEVQELLNSFDGPMAFITDEYEFNPEQFTFLKKLRVDSSFSEYEIDIREIEFGKKEEEPLSWRELFSLCKFYRNTFMIKKEDFVILLTTRKNVLNWFSHYDDDKNAFVHTGDWEYFIKASQRFPVAYQILENIMQYFMKINIEQMPNPNIHLDPLGCMNDFCQNKQQVILKLRTGDICYDCLGKLQAENVDEAIINQTIGIFETIRNSLLFRHGFTRNQNPKLVKIDAHGKIFIGDKRINLNPLESTLFIFFVTIEKGISLNDLQTHRDQLLNIYITIRPGGDKRKIEELIKPYHLGGTFSINKSRLNKKLKNEIGEPLANFYYVDGRRGETFKINVGTEFVSSEMRY